MDMFNLPMNNILVMQVSNTGQNLLHDSCCFKIRKLFSLLDLIVECASLTQPKLIRFINEYTLKLYNNVHHL